MRHEAKAETVFFKLMVQREMTNGTAWNTYVCLVISTGSYRYKHSVITSIVL